MRILLCLVYQFLLLPHAFASDFYQQRVRPVLNKRCVVCHGCYTSPCNLKLDSYFGALRGAHKSDVYASRFLGAMKPNRVLQDAVHHLTWQKEHDFYPVIKRSGNTYDNLNDSILYQMLNFRNLPDNGKKFEFDATASRQCVSNERELRKYFRKNNPLAGMPYGMEKLNATEFNILKTWIANGSPGPDYLDLPQLESIEREDSAIVKKWEALLNGSSKKDKLIARYLFEHFYAANIYFRPGRVFYRLVRSKTDYPFHVREIPTRRPYDSAGRKFYYRFKKVIETPVHKNHIPLKLGAEKLKRIKELFYDADWEVEGNLPGHNNSLASNPFRVFKDIPAKSRYKFFLENAYYFVRTFIHGPVCNGQVATNVIRDHFWIFFMDPDRDPTVNNEHFLKRLGRSLDLPAKQPNLPIYEDYHFKNYRYQRLHGELYKNSYPSGLSLSYLWDGEGSDPNAVLTVYRHFDSANVYFGAKGSFPKTAWVMDYPIFERIYYDLVAGFDVWGSAWHKIATRKYMDLLRTEAEDLFIAFLPESKRIVVRDKLNIGLGNVKEFFQPYYYKDFPSLQNEESIANLADRFLNRLAPEVSGGKDQYNNSFENYVAENYSSTENFVQQQLSRLTSFKKGFSKFFPEITLLKVGHDGFTILANKDRPYVNYMFIEPKNPQEDVLNILPGVDVSYANYFLEVSLDKLEAFVDELLKVNTKSRWRVFRAKYGKERLDKGFWKLSDWFQEQAVKRHPISGAIIDLSRYQ